VLRPLTIVAGKGGVGRSTTAAALALNAAASGKRVLAVDATNDGGLRAALSTAPRAERARVDLLELTTEESLDEYIKLYLKIPIPPSRLGPIARIFDYVATAAPGVREILTIGKIAYEVREQAWDAVIVDAPATGHVVELLAAPDTLREVVSVGPLAGQTQWIADLLRDPSITGVITVTTSETLPVTESLELLERLVETTEIDPIGFVVNRLPDLLDESGYQEADRLLEDLPARDPMARALSIVVNRSVAAVEELDRLAFLDLGLTWVGESADPVAAVRAALDEVGA
jgi:anion-transporting  ArsA/GET3 family ATPase